MITSFKTIAGLIILGGMLSLTACNSGKPDASPGEVTSATEAPAAVQPEASPSPAADAGTVSEPGADDGAAAGAEPVTADPGAAAGASTVTEAAEAEAELVAPATPEERSKQLKELLEFAKQGKVPGVEYAAHSGLIDEVEAAWGEPDLKESAGKGMYSTYSGKNAVIGFNKGSKIFDVRSNASNLQSLTLEQIEEVLGKPDATSSLGSDKIYIYQAGKQYQLKFIIPESTGTVDHISVFSEQDSINNMAG
ncbi:YjgB family protein [Paenibacillus tritici]|uniref:YjgB family protein n=1 Tax=Paenibacillus tritici TaxID=1873425 RepID=UPI001FEA4960|nr:YjgB family protein [Paenibacillus tritici]